MIEFDLAAVITSIGVIVTSWFSYNQYTKNKETDAKLERWKKEEEQKNQLRSENFGKVLGQIYKLLNKSKADRVYIVQPHPQGHYAYLTVQFESRGEGIEGMKDQIQNLPMSDVPQFSEQLSSTVWSCFTNIDEQVEDPMAKSMFMANGTSAVGVKRLNSHRGWVGNIFCEYIDEMTITEQQLRSMMHECAVNIQYILPDVKK